MASGSRPLRRGRKAPVRGEERKEEEEEGGGERVEAMQTTMGGGRGYGVPDGVPVVTYITLKGFETLLSPSTVSLTKRRLWPRPRRGASFRNTSSLPSLSRVQKCSSSVSHSLSQFCFLARSLSISISVHG